MTVTFVNPFVNTEGGVDEEGHMRYVNVYDVFTDVNDGADTARGAGAIAKGLPAYNDGWTWASDSNPHALAKSRKAVLVDVEATRKKWHVEITYTTKGQARDPSGATGSAEGMQAITAEPWEVEIGFIEGSRTESKDKDGNPIQNSAEEPRFAEVPVGFRSVMLKGNTSTADLAVHGDAVFKCNETAMWGLAVRQVFLAKWKIKSRWRGTTPYAAHDIEFWIAAPDELWNEVFIDDGTRELVDATTADPTKRYRRFDARDMPLGKVLLNGAGKKLDLVANPGGGVVAKNKAGEDGFKVIKEYDFLGNMTFLEDPLPGPFF